MKRRAFGLDVWSVGKSGKRKEEQYIVYKQIVYNKYY
jgi:hypothetical protein